MADMIFCGHCFSPRFQNVISEVSLHTEDLYALWDWAKSNNGKVTLRVAKGKTGKTYACIDTYNKIFPGQALPPEESQPPQSERRKYPASDRPEPPPDKIEDDIPF